MNEHPDAVPSGADGRTVPTAAGADDHAHLHAAPTEKISVRSGEMAGRSNDPAGPASPTAAGEAASPVARTGQSSYPIEDGRDGPGPAPYVTIVLPCFNEGEHVHARDRAHQPRR
jgi:hypothetical protein